MTDPVIRPLTESDAHLFNTLADPGLVGRAILGHAYSPVHEGGEYRPEWTWVALRDGVVVARAAWWAGPEDEQPVALDWFDFTDADAAARLLRTAPFHVEYDLLLPPGWRDRPEVLAAARSRIDAAVAGGLKPLVERYRYTWTPDCGLPDRPGRLEFRHEPDDAVVLDVLRRVNEGSLDAHTREATDKHDAGTAAQENLDFLNWLSHSRQWRQLAYTSDGTLVGIHVPGHNPAGPCVGFIGVLPGQRGHGYAYDLLAECTRVLVAEGAEKISAATDQGNFPMAAHFATAGYPITQERVSLV